jgi:hypothetical protein
MTNTLQTVIEVKPLPFPLIARLLKQRQADLVNYLWEEDVDNIKKAEYDIRTFMFKLERGEVYEVPF